MNIRNIYTKFSFVISFVAVVLSGSVSFAYDAELAESSKCSRYFSMYEEAFHMPSNLMKAVAVTESGKYVKSAGRLMAWPWTVNAQGKGYYFSSKREAIKAVNAFRAQGMKSIDVGCMQINLMHHPEAFRNLEQAFEPRYNIGYAAKFLRDKYMEARTWQAAIGRYHNVDPNINKKYIAQVYNAWRKEDGVGQEVAMLSTKPSITVKDAPKASSSNSPEVSAITKDVLSTFAR